MLNFGRISHCVHNRKMEKEPFDESNEILTKTNFMDFFQKNVAAL
jgi:hypothetical protein